MPFFALITLLAACNRDGKDHNTVKGAPEAAPGEDFLKDTDVRLTAPTRGEAITPATTVSWEAGADVYSVALEVDDDVVWGPEATDGTGSTDIELEGGRRNLTLVGYDADGEQLSAYTIPVRVSEEGETWVSIVSPSDGATVTNPVTFIVEASDDVESVRLEADGWELGTVAPGELITYEFTGTGYERQIDALGLVGEGVVADDAIGITVDPGSAPEASNFNDLVLEILDGYPTDGSHEYYWPTGGDWYGVTQDIYYQGELVAEGDPYGRCYCVGLTWEVYMRAFQEIDAMTGGDGSLNGLDQDDLSDFRVDWFVRDLWGDGEGVAMENYGLGDAVTDVADLQPGDFIQFWRYSGSGHSVIFLDWELDSDGDIIGIQYWSTQTSTDGINVNSEYFGSGGSSIDPSYFYAARARMPEDWGAWR